MCIHGLTLNDDLTCYAGVFEGADGKARELMILGGSPASWLLQAAAGVGHHRFAAVPAYRRQCPVD